MIFTMSDASFVQKRTYVEKSSIDITCVLSNGASQAKPWHLDTIKHAYKNCKFSAQMK